MKQSNYLSFFWTKPGNFTTTLKRRTVHVLRKKNKATKFLNIKLFLPNLPYISRFPIVCQFFYFFRKAKSLETMKAYCMTRFSKCFWKLKSCLSHSWQTCSNIFEISEEIHTHDTTLDFANACFPFPGCK